MYSSLLRGTGHVAQVQEHQSPSLTKPLGEEPRRAMRQVWGHSHRIASRAQQGIGACVKFDQSQCLPVTYKTQRQTTSAEVHIMQVTAVRDHTGGI